MVDVKNVAAKIENFEHKREKRNAAKHHVRQVAEERRDKQPHLCSVLTHLLLGSRFDPALEGGCGFCLVKNYKRSLADFPVFLPLLIGFRSGWRRTDLRCRRWRRARG